MPTLARIKPRHIDMMRKRAARVHEELLPQEVVSIRHLILKAIEEAANNGRYTTKVLINTETSYFNWKRFRVETKAISDESFVKAIDQVRAMGYHVNFGERTTYYTIMINWEEEK